jgi:hypothetical protein
MRDLTDEEAKIYNNRLESEAVDTAISILDNLRPSCESKLTFTEEEVYMALSTGISAIKELEKAKGLLKSAVEDLSITVAKVYNGGLVCECCKWKSQIDGCCCPGDGGCDVAYRWRYSDEAKKLLSDENK